MASEILTVAKNSNQLTPFLRTFACGSFSFVVMVMWELFEFFCDFYLVGSYNQNYIYKPDLNSIFFKIFGLGKNDIRQYPLFDTCRDLLCAVVGCAVASVLFYYICLRKQKKDALKAEAQKTEEASAINVQ